MSTAESQDTVPSSTVRGRVRRALPAAAPMLSWWVVAPVLMYLLLVLGGVSQSSIGIASLRVDPGAATPMMIGGGVGIRSDEYLTSTPLLLGVEATGETDDANPLTAPSGFLTQLPSGPVSSVVLFDGSLLRLGPLLPDQMLLAAHWWLPFLLLALGAPAFFGTLTGNRWFGAFAAAMIMLAPASAWWSFSPIEVLGFTLAGAAGMQRVVAQVAARRYSHAAAWCVGSAVLLARTPLHYQPWAIVLAITILVVAILPLVTVSVGRRAGLLGVGATGLLSVLLAGGVVLENLRSISATLGTVYPGARVASGGAGGVPELFAATDLAGLKHLEVVGSNPSEISSAFAVAAIWAVLLLVAGVVVPEVRHRRATRTMLAMTGFWFAWSMVDFGPWAARVPVLNMVPPNRSGDVIGYLGILLLCLVLPAVVRVPVRVAVMISSLLALVAAYAGSLLRASLVPGVAVVTIWLSSLLLGAVVLVISLRPRWWAGYAAAVALAGLLVWNVNPVLIGLADLRGTPFADRMLAQGAAARAAGELWASDDNDVNALLVATGVPSLSSRQLAGPDREAWAMLDPAGAAEQVWNRGGSFITFTWTGTDVLSFSNPSPDVIAISGSPCTVAADVPALMTIVASARLDERCLTETGSFEWGGVTRWIYRVAP